MSDPLTFIGIAGLLKQLADSLQNLKDKATERADEDLRKVALTIENKLLEIEIAAKRLAQENEDLRTQLQLKADLRYDRNSEVYWLRTGSRFDGPFCPKHFDNDGRSVRMQHRPLPKFLSKSGYVCPVCQTSSASHIAKDYQPDPDNLNAA